MAGNGATLPGTTISRRGFGVLIRGRSGSGKSDLALRAITSPLQLPGESEAAPFELVSDDQTSVRVAGARLLASAPPPIRNLLEVRGIGLIEIAALAEAELVLIADLTDQPIERLPQGAAAGECKGERTAVFGHHVDRIALHAFEPSAPIKLALAIAHAAERRRLDSRCVPRLAASIAERGLVV